MKWLFWASVFLIAYTYVGYMVWLWLRAWLRPWPVQRGKYEPDVSVVMVVRNEEQVLEDKIRNLLELDYPPDRCHIVVVSDGSTDRTEAILHKYGTERRLHAVMNQLSQGKALSLNDGLMVARGEVVVFTDARQKIEPGAIRVLTENFVDPDVGCASGELVLGDQTNGESRHGTGLYWRIEKSVRELEAASGSAVGATGAFYAVRRELLTALPGGTILDDVYLPMEVVRQGKRVVFDPRARAWDTPDLGAPREFSRKVRTLTGNYQLLQLAPWLLSRSNPIRFEFVSHKLLRLTVPFLLLAMLLSAAFIAEPLYRFLLVLQLAFYALSLLVMIRMKAGVLTHLADASFTFVILNTAAIVAFANFVTGRKVAWTR